MRQLRQFVLTLGLLLGVVRVGYSDAAAWIDVLGAARSIFREFRAFIDLLFTNPFLTLMQTTVPPQLTHFADMQRVSQLDGVEAVLNGAEFLL